MYKIFIPVNKGKHKTSIRGFWLDNKKTYYDYLKIITKKNLSKNKLKYYCQKYNQLALFFIKNKNAGIFDNRTNKIEWLRNYKRFKIKNNLKNNLKKLLKNYGGITVYIKKDYYIFEVWYK